MNRYFAKILVRYPGLEVLMRRLYWKNPRLREILASRIPKEHLNVSAAPPIDFDAALQSIEERTPLKGRLVVLHSSYEALMTTRLHYRQILAKIEAAIGENGTLAMPVIRRFPEVERFSPFDPRIAETKCIYDVQKSDVVSGALPFYMLLRDKKSVVSRFPLNPMIAKGPLAEPMMEHNLEGDFPTPHGPHSAWKFCMDNNALILGLGVRLAHHITMVHVAEDVFPWPVSRDKWYWKRRFTVIDGTFRKEMEVFERRPEWGMFHLPEFREEYEYRKEGILKSWTKDGLVVSLAESGRLMDCLKNRSGEGFPYWIPQKSRR